MQETGDFIYAFAIGMLVGVGELVGRYRDEPAQALRTRPAYLYSAINGLASAVALIFAHTFHWTFGATEGTPEGRLMQVVVAGFGAMALFRSSLFIYRHEGTDIGIGPVAFLEVMLDATDRAVDRRRAQSRDKAMENIMGDLALKDVDVALLTLASNLMQNFSVEDQTRLATQVKKVRDEVGLEDRIKVIQIGLIVMNVVGEEVLRSIVNTIKRERDHLKPPAPSPTGLAAIPAGFAAILNNIRQKPAPGSSTASPSEGSEPATQPAALTPPDDESADVTVAAESAVPAADAAADATPDAVANQPSPSAPNGDVGGEGGATPAAEPPRRRRRRTKDS